MNQKHINLLQKTWKRIYRAIGERKPLRGLWVGIFSLPSCGWLAGRFDLQLPWSQSSRKFSWANKQYIPHFLHFHLFIIFMSQWIIESDILITREARHTDERNAVRGDSCALFKTFNIWINPLSLFCFLASSKCCFSSSNRSFPKTNATEKANICQPSLQLNLPGLLWNPVSQVSSPRYRPCDRVLRQQVVYTHNTQAGIHGLLFWPALHCIRWIPLQKQKSFMRQTRQGSLRNTQMLSFNEP